MDKTHVPEYWEIAELYDLISSKYVNYNQQVLFLTQLFEKYRIPGRRILDIACGTGTHALMLCDKGYEVVGVDSSGEMLKVAKKKTEDDKQIRFVRRDMRVLDFDEEFDAAICVSSISFLLTLEDIKRTLLGVNRALNSGGVFIFDFLPIYDATQLNTIEHIKDGKVEIWILHQGFVNRMEQTFDEKLTYIVREDNKIRTHEGFDRGRLLFPIDFIRYLENEGGPRVIGFHECWDLAKKIEGKHLAAVAHRNETLGH